VRAGTRARAPGYTFTQLKFWSAPVTESENPRQHLLGLLKKFDTAMLITHAPDGQ
jgi:hypothetical protein